MISINKSENSILKKHFLFLKNNDEVELEKRRIRLALKLNNYVKLKFRSRYIRKISLLKNSPLRRIFSLNLKKYVFEKSKSVYVSLKRKEKINAFLGYPEKKIKIKKRKHPLAIKIKRDRKNTFFLSEKSLISERKMLSEENDSNFLPYHYIFVFKIRPHNFFCHLIDSEGKTVFPLKSAAQLGIKISRSTRRIEIWNVMSAYARELQNYFKEQKMVYTPVVVFRIGATSKFRKKIYLAAKRFFMVKNSKKQKHSIVNKSSFDYFVDYVQVKQFNGCRGVNLKRKKRFKLSYCKYKVN